MDEKGYDFKVYAWPWTKTVIPLSSRVRRALRHYRRISQFNLLCGRLVIHRVTLICFVRKYAALLKQRIFIVETCVRYKS